MKDFKQEVLRVVKGIKTGSVMTYKEVAKKAGNEKASRAVGTIMANNQDLEVPCHRVVRSDGSIGPYNGLRKKSKAVLLKEEGMTVKDGKVVALQFLRSHYSK